jgi:hypothetical protein
MPAKLNSEFNYRTQVIGETTWERIKTLKGFLEGRKRAEALERVSEKKFLAKKSKVEWLRNNNGPEHEILELEGEIIELESVQDSQKEAYELNRQEIAILEKLLAELYAEAEPTRIDGYTDEQMFELNAQNEFTVWCAREIHSEILAYGHPSAARLKNAMSCPTTWIALQKIGLIPQGTPILENNDPRQIELKARLNNELLKEKPRWNDNIPILPPESKNGKPDSFIP